MSHNDVLKDISNPGSNRLDGSVRRWQQIPLEVINCGELFYMLRTDFLVESDQTNVGKYIHGTFLQLYQYLEGLRSLGVALDAGELPCGGELI